MDGDDQRTLTLQRQHLGRDPTKRRRQRRRG